MDVYLGGVRTLAAHFIEISIFYVKVLNAMKSIGKPSSIRRASQLLLKFNQKLFPVIAIKPAQNYSIGVPRSTSR